MTLTTTGNTPVNGLSPGKEFSLALSGTFDGATVKAQYATAGPVKASLVLDDAESDPAINLTAADAGTAGNDVKIALVTASTANAPLSHSQTGRVFTVSLATNAGDAATAQIGTGANGTVDITSAVVGPQGNDFDVQVVLGSGNSLPMSAIVSGANARPRLLVTLGTNSGGTADNAKNTATLIAAAIGALPQFTATATGTGADAVAVKAVTAFADGGDNAANATTVGQLLAYLKKPEFERHFLSALATDADVTEIIAPLAETALASGTAGTFVDFPASASASFTAAGSIVVYNPGVLPTINLNVASAGGSTSVVALITPIKL